MYSNEREANATATYRMTDGESAPAQPRTYNAYIAGRGTLPASRHHAAPGMRACRCRGHTQSIDPALWSTLRLARSLEYLLCGRSFRTAMANAFLCPTSTSSRLLRVIPV